MFLRRWARNSGALDWIAPIYTRSHLLYTLRNGVKNTYGRWRGHWAIVWRDALLEGRTNLELEAAWERADENLGHFAQLARQHGFRPVVFVLPIEHQIEEDRLARFQDLVRSRAASHGLTVMDPGPCLKVAARSQTVFLPFDGRPSFFGHAVLAEALADPSAYQQMPWY